jgi:hypothetical protein
MIERPTIGITIAGPIALMLVGVGFTGEGVATGRWGGAIAAAWQNEQIARQNLAVARQFLNEHSKEKPARVYDWQLRSYGPRWYNERRQKRIDWEERQTNAEKIRDTARAKIPSVWSPAAPTLDAEPAWQSFYDLHHFLFGTIYAPIILFYLLVGIVLGWASSDRYLNWKWGRARQGVTPEQSLVGAEDNGRGRPLYLTQAERNRHLLIAGTTGSGKTEALRNLVRHDIESGRGLVFIDMKGDRGLAEAVFDDCVRCGRRDDFLFLTFEPGPSHSYNPLASGDPIAKRDRLLGSCTWSEEAFYRNEAKAASGRVFKAVDGRGAITFDDLYPIFDEEQAFELISRWAPEVDRPKFERVLEHWSQFWNNTSGLRANLHEFTQLRDRLCVAHADIDFREVHGRDRIVYFELNSQMRGEAASALAKIILEDLKHLSGELASGPAELRKPFSIYIDEARNAVDANFAKFITQCRSAGIGLVLATQSPLDFQDCGAGTLLAVVQNTASKLIFCQLDPESAQLCAELGGTKDTVKRTVQMIDQGLIAGMGASGTESEREVKEFFVHPDQIKALGVGEAFFIGSGTRALLRTPPPLKRKLVPFRPTIPRKWVPGDRERLGHSQPPLDLASLVSGPRVVRSGRRR